MPVVSPLAVPVDAPEDPHVALSTAPAGAGDPEGDVSADGVVEAVATGVPEEVALAVGAWEPVGTAVGTGVPLDTGAAPPQTALDDAPTPRVVTRAMRPKTSIVNRRWT